MECQSWIAKAYRLCSAQTLGNTIYIKSPFLSVNRLTELLTSNLKGKMVVNILQSLLQIAAYLKVQAGKISLNDDALPTRVVNKSTSTGYLNIIVQLISESKTNLDLEGRTDLEKAQVRQWIQYALTFASQTDSSINIHQIQELCEVLACRTFLVAHRLSIADIALYFILQGTMEKLTIFDKERYLHVSRWFDNLQGNSAIRQSNEIVPFTTIYLSTVAPARH